MAKEAAQVQAQQVTYELTQCSRKADLNSATLTKEIAAQVEKRKRVEESMENGQREMNRQQRLSNKHDRQLQIDKAALQHQQTLCLSMTDRLVHERKVIRDEREEYKKSMCAARKGREGDREVSSIFVRDLAVSCRIFLTHDSLITLLFKVLQDKLAKLQKAKQLTNHALTNTTRKLLRAVGQQRNKKWTNGKAEINHPPIPRYNFHSSCTCQPPD
jgi:hypothetical protein